MPPPPADADRPLELIINFDFEEHEFLIQFPTHNQAQLYEDALGEARIDKNQSSVWLPTSGSMKSIRGCEDGLAIVFDSEANASAWKKRVVIGHIERRRKKEVHLRRFWEEEELIEAIEKARQRRNERGHRRRGRRRKGRRRRDDSTNSTPVRIASTTRRYARPSGFHSGL
jgi:hypothetical protein